MSSGYYTIRKLLCLSTAYHDKDLKGGIQLGKLRKTSQDIQQPVRDLKRTPPEQNSLNVARKVPISGRLYLSSYLRNYLPDLDEISH